MSKTAGGGKAPYIFLRRVYTTFQKIEMLDVE